MLLTNYTKKVSLIDNQIPAEAQPQITAITQEAGTLTVEIPRYDVSGGGTCWHILVAVEKGSLDSGDQISLVME